MIQAWPMLLYKSSTLILPNNEQAVLCILWRLQKPSQVFQNEVWHAWQLRTKHFVSARSMLNFFLQYWNNMSKHWPNDLKFRLQVQRFVLFLRSTSVLIWKDQNFNNASCLHLLCIWAILRCFCLRLWRIKAICRLGSSNTVMLGWMCWRILQPNADAGVPSKLDGPNS